MREPGSPTPHALMQLPSSRRIAGAASQRMAGAPSPWQGCTAPGTCRPGCSDGGRHAQRSPRFRPRRKRRWQTSDPCQGRAEERREPAQDGRPTDGRTKCGTAGIPACAGKFPPLTHPPSRLGQGPGTQKREQGRLRCACLSDSGQGSRNRARNRSTTPDPFSSCLCAWRLVSAGFWTSRAVVVRGNKPVAGVAEASVVHASVQAQGRARTGHVRTVATPAPVSFGCAGSGRTAPCWLLAATPGSTPGSARGCGAGRARSSSSLSPWCSWKGERQRGFGVASGRTAVTARLFRSAALIYDRGWGMPSQRRPIMRQEMCHAPHRGREGIISCGHATPWAPPTSAVPAAIAWCRDPHPESGRVVSGPAALRRCVACPGSSPGRGACLPAPQSEPRP